MKKLFALLFLFIFIVSLAAAVELEWDKSSLTFDDDDSTCGTVTAHICNHGEDMDGSVDKNHTGYAQTF